MSTVLFTQGETLAPEGSKIIIANQTIFRHVCNFDPVRPTFTPMNFKEKKTVILPAPESTIIIANKNLVTRNG